MVEFGLGLLVGIGDVQLGLVQIREDSFSRRLEKFERVLTHWLGGVRPEIEKFIIAARQAAIDRNRILHRGWESAALEPTEQAGLDALVVEMGASPPVLLKTWLAKRGQLRAFEYSVAELDAIAEHIETATSIGEHVIWETMSSLVHPSSGDVARLWKERTGGGSRPPQRHGE
jgi:hypothetical protein